MTAHDKSTHRTGLTLLTVGALGVVFGDIGTSPLYAFRETFEGHHLPVTETNVVGALSLVFWALTIIVSVKYLAYVLRADNRGEGGILALTALVVPPGRTLPRGLKALLVIGLFGTALLYGDGVITPAISVLSAVEGLKVAAPALSDWVVPLAVGILLGLFSIQKRGTGAVGAVFGPFMVAWFAILGILGIINLTKDLSVLAAINPVHGFEYLTRNSLDAFLSLGAIFLVVTGGEALYADLGHFGRRPIQTGWFVVALPALLLNYFGQGALLAADPKAIEAPFFLMGPDWARYPLVILATGATIIASQALISGAFSLTVQAMQLDYLPRLAINHTSAAHSGQVYVPLINWALMVGSVSVVLAFRTSSALAAAYGVAVTGTMAITTLLMASFALRTWKWKPALVYSITIPLLVIDLAFFAANVAKIPEGGWFPLVVGALLITIMTTWRTGRSLVAERIGRGKVSIEQFLAEQREAGTARVPGTAVFLFRGTGAAPPALIANTLHNHVLHEKVIILSVQTEVIPHVDPANRADVTLCEDNVYQVVLHFGFMEEPNVGRALRDIPPDQLTIDPESVSFFLGRETVVTTPQEGMARWRERLFAFQHRIATSAARFFNLPAKQVCEVGTPVEI